MTSSSTKPYTSWRSLRDCFFGSAQAALGRAGSPARVHGIAKPIGRCTDHFRPSIIDDVPVSGIFINYRSEDSQLAAALIDRELAAVFGSDQVFLDSRSIPAGADFANELLERIRACNVLL